jgi:hypothetical protein
MIEFVRHVTFSIVKLETVGVSLIVSYMAVQWLARKGEGEAEGEAAADLRGEPRRIHEIGWRIENVAVEVRVPCCQTDWVFA